MLNADVAGCIDVDLSFTPATNLFALRRLELKVGEHANAPAAYLNSPVCDLQDSRNVMNAWGERHTYEAPTVGYAGNLQASSLGAVLRYPGLFELLRPN